MEECTRVFTEDCQNYGQFLKNNFENLIKKALNLKENDKVVIVKRNKQLKCGDYSVILPQSATVSSDCEAKIDDELRKDPNGMFGRISKDKKGNIVTFLDRAKIFQRAISTVVDRGTAYGSTDRPRSKDVTIVNPFPLTEITQDVTLDNVRALLLSQHAAALLEANGVPTVFLRKAIISNAKKTLNLFGVNTEEMLNDEKLSLNEAFNVLTSSEYCEKNSDSFVINLKQFKEGHPNLPKSNVGNFQFIDDSNDMITELDCVKQVVETLKSPCCLHIVPFQKQFQMQQFDFLWRISEQKSHLQVEQMSLVCGLIASQEKSTSVLNASDFYQLRFKQMQEASEMKYGQVVKEESWKKTIHSITVAAIKFELLSMVAHQQANVDFKANESAVQGNKGGVFVMYNCARLSTLFSNYEKAVEKGVYPPLPAVSKIDFTVLKEEDEWSLVFNYVVLYPDLILNCVMLNGNKIQCHKVCQFLQDLSRDLSSYYCRTHILGEPRPHLLPLMFARLYLLRSVYQVLCNGLTLLGLQPMHQL